MDETDALREFLSQNDILIVDATSSARVSLAATLVQLGGSRARMSLAGTMEEARAEIRRIKPRLIFCDFMIGKESGLDLIQDQRQVYPPGQLGCLFTLVTGDASQSAVARAAEEDVDTFVIKPYTLQSFENCLADALQAKLDPDDYARLIEAGKKGLAAGELDVAKESFAAAKQLDEAPTLACFYLGQADRMRKEIDEAAGSFREGLDYNQIHYKCLVGLFDLYMQEEKHAEAYEIVKRLARFFPANPKRLTSVLRLAVITGSYADVPGYYELFTHLEPRTDELVRYVCSALAVAGKFHLGQGDGAAGMLCFERIATSCAGRIQYMKYAVETLLSYGCVAEASAYLSRFPAELRGKAEYLVAHLLVAAETRPAGEVIQLARDLLRDGIDDPGVYEVLIAQSVRANLRDSAEQLASEAAKKWPERADAFTALAA